MPKYHVRRRESKLFRLRELIGELTIKTAVAKVKENESEYSKQKNHLDRVFRYATAIGMNTYEVKMKCSFEFTTKVCGFNDHGADYYAVQQVWDAVPNISIREMHMKSIKEISKGNKIDSESI